MELMGFSTSACGHGPVCYSVFLFFLMWHKTTVEKARRKLRKTFTLASREACTKCPNLQEPVLFNVLLYLSLFCLGHFDVPVFTSSESGYAANSQ